jgi:hypothetical protein
MPAALLLLLLAAPAGQTAAPAGQAARAFLAAAYEPYTRRPAGSTTLDDKSAGKWLAPELVKLIDEAEEGPAARREVPALHLDHLVRAQGLELTALQVKVQERPGGKASGNVTFKSAGRPVRVTAELVRLKAGWRIADLGYDDGTSLLRLLKKAAAEDRARYWVHGSAREFLQATYGGYARSREEGAPEPENRPPSQAFAPDLAAAMGTPFTEPATQSDPLLDASGYHPESLHLTALKVEVKEKGFYRAAGTVSFTNLGQDRAFELELVRFPEGWVIDDIRYGPGESLRALLGVGRPVQPQPRFEEFAEKFRLAVKGGDAAAVVELIEPTGLVVGGTEVIPREKVLAELKAHRGPLHRTLFSTAEERRKGRIEVPPAFLSYQEFFKANEGATRWHADLGGLVLVRWHLGGPELAEPARMVGPGLMVVRDFAGRLWFRNFGDLD